MRDRTSSEDFHKLVEPADPQQFDEFPFWLLYHYPDICLFDASEAQGRKYALAPSCGPMNHGDEDFSIRGFTLHYLSEMAASTKCPEEKGWPDEDSDWNTISIPTTVGEAHEVKSIKDRSVKAVFMPLGWLVEMDTRSSSSRRYVTNYAVLLNLSTKPLSLWLAYDYHPLDTNGRFTTRSLSHPDCANPAYHPDPRLNLAQGSPFKESGFELAKGSVLRRKLLDAFGVQLWEEQQ